MSSGRFLERPVAEKKTETYRLYLEEKSVLEAVTKALAKMYVMRPEDRPDSPLEFVVKELSGALPSTVAVAAYKKAHEQAMAEIEEWKKKAEAAQKEISELKKRLKEKPRPETPSADEEDID